MTNDQKQLPTDVLINGGQDIEVTLRDGTKQTVKVRLVPLSKAGRFIELEAEMTKFVELVCDKPEGWADTLIDDSVYAIDDLAHGLNDPRIDRFLLRQMKTVERFAPVARKVAALTAS